jgi:glutathione S-transferase
MIELHHHPLCAASRAVRLLLNEVQSPVTLVEVKPWDLTRDFLNLNPAGTTPVLMADGRVVCGANAVVEFIHESQDNAAQKAVWPTHLFDRAEARRVADWFLRKFDTEVTAYLVEEKAAKPLSGQRNAPDLNAIRAARGNLRYHLAYIAYLFERRRWLGGDHFSFADMAAAGQIGVMDYLSEIAWPDYPEVKSWYERVKSRPAMRPLLPDRVAGVIPPAWFSDLDF